MSSAEKPSEDASATVTETNEDTVTDGVKSLMNQKVDGGKKSVWAMTLETFKMSDGGKHKKSDVTAKTMEEAMESMRTMIANGNDCNEAKWKMEVSPLIELNATKDDVLVAYLKWSKKDKDNDKEEEPVYNVTKAYRRLEGYVTWMEQNRKDLEQPLTVDSISKAAEMWNMKITYDAKDRLCWWIDMGEMDFQFIKNTVPVEDSLRYFVWLSHVVMLNPKAQDNGMIFIESMGYKGMYETMTMLPMDLGTKLDRLTIGTLPVKMKVCYVLQGAMWIRVMMSLFKPFMSKKMRQRIVVVGKKEDPQKILDDEVGKEAIPAGFGGLKGAATSDVVFGQLVKSQAAFVEDHNE